MTEKEERKKCKKKTNKKKTPQRAHCLAARKVQDIKVWYAFYKPRDLGSECSRATYCIRTIQQPPAESSHPPSESQANYATLHEPAKLGPWVLRFSKILLPTDSIAARSHSSTQYNKETDLAAKESNDLFRTQRSRVSFSSLFIF